ncbi:lanthionine synthetase C family protein [Streptomyces sp. NPDC048623]|uniref:lanthionine synthetase C family protein n=1 Tax=Streptomyces sp. NPDC048623 TaxID=3155761 RepID=UPI003449A4BB
MAHGVTGPPLLLALAARKGLTVAGHLDAIRAISTWLGAWQQTAEAGAWWPETITPSELAVGQPDQRSPTRPSWYYGTPGIARAGQLAALALDDREMQRDHEQALADCLSDPAQLRQVSDSGLCHGWAGLYQTVWRAAQDAAIPALSEQLPALGTRLREHVDRGHEERSPDSEGFLNGHAGTALALLTHMTNRPPVSGWDACLLID